MMAVVATFERGGVRLVGPNCPGIVLGGRRQRGHHAGRHLRPGPVGVVSRSGTLTYQIVSELNQVGLGQTTVVGMGGDPVHGVGFLDCLALFEADPATGRWS